MKYELRESHGIPAPLLALMAVATGLSVANCYYNQPLLGSMAKDFGVSDFSASMVATLTQIGYVVGLVFISGYVQKYGVRFFSIVGGCVILAAWLLAFLGNDSYLWMIIAILLIDAGMQCIHLSNQTSVVTLDASAINRVNTVYMTIYFLGGSAGTFVSGLFWQHYGWAGVVGVGVAFTVASLFVNCFQPRLHKDECSIF